METSDEPVIVSTSRLKSLVWNDFDRIKKGDTFVAVCRHCKKKLCGGSSSGTSHLRNHLVRCKKKSNHDLAQLYVAKEKKKGGSLALSKLQQKKDQKLKPLNERHEETKQKDAPIIYGGVNFNQKRSEDDLARMIVLHGYSLAMVDHVGFQKFVRNLQPLFEFITINRLEACCKEVYQMEKQKVYEVLDKLPGKISLGLDKLSAIKGTDYLCMTAHYIDEAWVLQKKSLNFIMVDPSRTDDLVAEDIMTCLMDWDIDRKLFSMTVDCCSSNDNIVSRIRDRLSQNRFLLCKGQLFDVRCAADILKVMVLDVLEASSELTDKIRGSIQYIRSSQIMNQNFNQLAQEDGVDSVKSLCLDDPCHWNSTYYMIDAALEYRSVFLRLQKLDPAYTTCPSNVEWERIRNISSYLKLFFEVSNAFTWGTSPTANLYFAELCSIHSELIEWCKSSDDYLWSLASKMKSKFDEFWKKSNLPLAVAAVLDPRFKMKLVEYYYPQIYGNDADHHINVVGSTIKTLYNEHATCSPLSSYEGLSCQVRSNNGTRMGYLSGGATDSRDRLTGYDKFLQNTSQSLSIDSDLDKYLEEPLFPRNVDFNILEWWEQQTPRYPVVSMMARTILGIPMSKVSPESAYDTRGNRFLDHPWTSLGPDTFQTLMCANDWMHSEIPVSRLDSSGALIANPDA